MMPVDRRLQATNHHPLTTGPHDPGFVSQKNLDMGSGSWGWHPRTVVRGERLPPCGERLGRCSRRTTVLRITANSPARIITP